MTIRRAVPVLFILGLVAIGSGRSAAQDSGVRAQLISRSTGILSSEVAGKVTALPYREGEAFHEGEEIAAIGCATYEAKRALADAQVRRGRRKVESLRLLDQRGAIGKMDLDLAEIEVEAAEAEYRLAAVDVSRCSITAPFSGRIAELKVHPYQYVSAGEPMMDIVSDRDLEVELLAPSRWLSWLTPGAAFKVRIDELERDFPAVVTRMGARIDPVSQTIKVFARIDGDYPELVPGMSGVALLVPSASKAAAVR